jgi:LPXTG-motif cell wall-anchored protein
MSAPSFVVRGLLVAGLVVAAPASAVAADEIGLSKDGSSWSSTLPAPLFDPDFRWVPGDDETGSFFVRNQGPTGARLTISVRAADTDQLLSNADIELSARVDGGSWITLANGVATSALTQRSIIRGGTARVDVRVRFDPASANQSQTKSLPLTFIVTLTQASGSGRTPRDNSDDDSNGGGDDGRDGDLPGTGSTVAPAMLWVAAMLIGGGLALVRRSKREERVDV